MIYVCSKCRVTTTGWTGQCAACKAWHTMRPNDGRARAPTAQETRSFAPRRASDIEVASEPLYSTGIKAWDAVLGGGAGLGSILCAGEPGIGKTTHVIYAACHIAAQLGGECLFLSGEMPEEFVVVMGRRLGADLARMLVYVTDSVDAAEAVCMQVRPVVVVWDSVQAFLCPSGSDGLTVEVCRRALAIGREVRSQTWLISQLNKDGDPEGRRRLQHAVDTVLGLEKGVVKVGKNRFAPGNKEGPWAFGEVV